MAVKTTPTEQAKGDEKESGFAVIDMKKPIWLVMHQTTTRNNFEVFQGPDAEANAKASASAKAVRIKGQVAVIGPQKCVFKPPEPSAAKEVQLDWLAE